jgi:hypothetical protein
MAVSTDELWEMSKQALIAVYIETRRSFAEKKFARDTARARLEWMRAKAFDNVTGGVTERRMAVDLSEELARKGQEIREMTRELDLLKVDVDGIAIVMRLRGTYAPESGLAEESANDEPQPYQG